MYKAFGRPGKDTPGPSPFFNKHATFKKHWKTIWRPPKHDNFRKEKVLPIARIAKLFSPQAVFG